MKFIMILTVIVLVSSANAQLVGEEFNSLSIVSIADTTVTTAVQVVDVAQNKISESSETSEEEDLEREEANNRSAALLLASVIGYAIYMFTISGK